MEQAEKCITRERRARFSFLSYSPARIFVRMQFGICNEIFQDWALEDTFAFAAGAGYDAVEIAPFTIAKYVTEIGAIGRNRIREAAARMEIGIAGIHWVLVQADGMYLTSPEPDIRRRSAQYLVDLVDFCADLGGTRIIVGSPKQRNIADGVEPELAWNWAAETFR
ncbi:MAG TPA: TIM barrel protein, partial [Chthoniobacteraceae bacterium]